MCALCRWVQEPQFRVPEVLPGQVQRVLVQVVAEPDQRRLAVLGVDHRARERAVEPVDRARRQRPHGAGREGVAVRVERLGRLAQRVDRQHLRAGERVLRDLHLDVVDDRVREPDRVHPQLVGLVAERVLLTHARAGRRRQRRHLRRAERLGRLQDRQRVVERVEDQRRDRERLDVERLGDRLRRRPENAVRAEESPLRQGRLHDHLAGAQTDGGDADRARTQDVTTGDAMLLGLSCSGSCRAAREGPCSCR